VSTFGWESLTPVPESRQLGDDSGELRIGAKLRNAGKERGRFLVLKMRDGDRHTHLVFDEDFTLLAHSHGKLDKTSWEQVRAILRGKDIEIA
jgi:hypothetical protein